MTDQPTQQPTPPTQYPGFPITSEGLAVLYRELGKHAHRVLELELELAAERARAQKIVETYQAILAQHGVTPIEAAAPEPTSIGAGKPPRKASGE